MNNTLSNTLSDTFSNTLSNSMDFKTLKNIITKFEPMLLENKPNPLPNKIDVPSAVQEQYLQALQNHTNGVKPPKGGFRTPRVCLFRWDDGVKPRKSNVLHGQNVTPPSALSTPPKQSNVSSFGRPKLTNHRRVVAYVWVDCSVTSDETKEETRQGFVFYGGSVYNPKFALKDFLKLLRNCNSVEELNQTLTKGFTVPPYNKKGENQTAVSRLSTCPVVFSTTATSHAQVRKEVSKHMFSMGVKSRRVKNTMVDSGVESTAK